MPWTGPAFLVWFESFHDSAEATRMVRSVAARHDVSGLADDLHQSWYLSIRGTVDRMATTGGHLPAWLDHEEAAIRYAVRALHNDATDLTRIQRRHRSRVVDLGDGRNVVADLTQLRDPAADPELDAGGALAIEAVRAEIERRFRSGELGCAQCRNDRVASLALAVVERLTGGGPQVAAGGGVTGGTSDWDKVVYEALAAIDPQRFTPENGRMSAPARQMKVRCGNRVRDVLQELFAIHFPGAPIADATPVDVGDGAR